MRQYAILFAAVLLSTACLQAQQPAAPAGKPLDQQKPTQVNRQELGSDQLVPVNRSSSGPQSPTESLRQQYSHRGPGDIMGPDNKPLDINRVKVITPANYATLQPEAQAEIDADPYYVVTDKSRKEAMADFVRQYSRVTENPALSNPEGGIRVVTQPAAQPATQPVGQPAPDRLPSQAEKEAVKAAQQQHRAEPMKPGADPE